MVKQMIISILIAIFLFSTLGFSLDRPNSKIIDMAKKAWSIEKNHNPYLKPIITIIDFSKSSYTKRLYVIDLRTNRIIYSEPVSHGSGSGKGDYVTSVSNLNNSRQSSVGVYITTNTYYGKHGYSLRLQGLEKGFNNNAADRAIVVHGAKYVNSNYAGHSWGCFALRHAISSQIIDVIKNNSLIFVYYPDSNWLNNSKYLGN